MKRGWRRLRALFSRERREREMREEMEFHLDERTREQLDTWRSEQEARRAARRKFGGVEQVKEIAREQRRGRWLEDLARDVAYGLRALRRSPGFSVAAMLTLALGIGANAAVFSLMHRLFVAALPVEAPERLVAVVREHATQGENTLFPDEFFRQLTAERQDFVTVLARSRGVERVTVGTEAGGEPARGLVVAGTWVV
jgi:hypothetical protein